MIRSLMMAVVAVVVVMAPAAVAASSQPAGLPPARRSRFLANSLPIYDCSKKSAAVCLAPGSPGPTCCAGQCVDTVSSADHCGGCNKVCRHGKTCCGGRCVDLSSERDNCGRCSNRCDKKCSFGFCDYA